METPSLLGVNLAECSTLASSKYRALRSIERPDNRVFHSTEAAKCVLAAVAVMHEPIDPNLSTIDTFENIAGIDVGEAVLFSTLASLPDAKLLTGDKRAMRALATLDAPLREPFVKRIVCVERVVEAALNAWGLEKLRELICPWKKVDKTIDIVMGSRCDSSESAVRDGLASYIRELERLCDPTLICDEFKS